MLQPSDEAWPEALHRRCRCAVAHERERRSPGSAMGGQKSPLTSPGSGRHPGTAARRPALPTRVLAEDVARKPASPVTRERPRVLIVEPGHPALELTRSRLVISGTRAGHTARSKTCRHRISPLPGPIADTERPGRHYQLTRGQQEMTVRQAEGRAGRIRLVSRAFS